MANQITPLPIPPSRSDPANFAARGDAFLGALPQFQTETNAVATEAETNRDTAVLKASEALASQVAAKASEDEAEQWASLTDGLVVSTDYSAKEWAIGDFVPDYSAKRWAIDEGIESAKAWAKKINTTVDGTDYSAKEWAVGTTVEEGSSKFWAGISVSAGNFTGLYNPATNYSLGQTVSDKGIIYASLVDNNINNPTNDKNFWVQVIPRFEAGRILFFGSF